jgi:hypothetical protein
MLLPGNEYTFHFKGKGATTGETYEGDFTVSCLLTNSEQMEVAIRTDRYGGGSKSLPEQYKLMNRVFAELDLRVKKAPTWWKESNGGWDLHDANIVNEVFNEAMKAVEHWTNKLKDKATEAEKTAEAAPIKK